jgi:hypothetical protein
MMDCRQIKQLLPLFVGQDLPDSATTSDVSKHLEHCLECEQRRVGLQKSLEILQASSAVTLSVDVNRQSVLPKLMTRISEWDSAKYRDRFNGWIPASVMALAVALMVAVSIPSIQDEFFGAQSNPAAMDLTDFQFSLDSTLKVDQPGNATQGQKKSALVPAVYKPAQF